MTQPTTHPAEHSALDQLSTYTAASAYLEQPPEDRSWPDFVELCEAFIIELEAFAEADPTHDLEALELMAEQRLKASFGEWRGLDLPLEWLLPWFLPPWSARFVDEVSLSFQLEYKDQLFVPAPDDTYLRLQPGFPVGEIPDLERDHGALGSLSHEMFRCFGQLLPQLERLRLLQLDLPEEATADDLSACWTHLAQCQGLRMAEIKLGGNEQLASLATPSWPHLTSLALRSYACLTLDPDVPGTFPALTSLRLDFDWFDETLSRFLHPERFPALTELELIVSTYVDRALPREVFAAIGSLPQLASLCVVSEQLRAASLLHLAVQLPQDLRGLRIRTRSPFPGDRLLRSLLRRAPYSQLHSLALHNITMEDETFARFVETAHTHFPALSALELAWDECRSDHLMLLCDHPLLGQLSELSLFDARLTSEDARYLANADGFDALTSLYVYVEGAGAFGLDEFRRTYQEQDDQERLAALREILDVGTLHYGWEDFCKQLDTWDDPHHFEDVALPYIEQHLTPLPSDVRTLPMGWLERMRRGHDFPALQLIHHALSIFDQESILALAASQHLCQLRILEISGYGATVTSELVERLRQAAFWPMLEELTINNTIFAPDDITALLHGLGTTSLRKLDLRADSPSQLTLPAEAIAAFATSSASQSLRELSLKSIPLDEESVPLLLRPHEAQLERLSFTKLQTPGRWLPALVEALPESLTQLDLSYNRITDEELTTLIAQDNLPALAALDLSNNRLQDLSELQEASWPALRWLSLNKNRLSLEGLQRLLASPFAAQLEYLDLASCRFSREQPWAELLAASPSLSKLTKLYLYDNEASHRQCEALADSPHLAIHQSPREWYEHIN